MKNVIIFGTSQYSEKIFHYITMEKEYNVIAFTNNKNFITKNRIMGIPVIPFEELNSKTFSNMNDIEVLVTYGYSGMNCLREKIFNQVEAEGFAIGSFISKNALIYTNKKNIQRGAIIFPNVFIGPNVKIGKGCIISASVSISHDSKIGHFSFFSTGVVVGGFTNIEEKTFIGLNSTLKNGITIAKFSLIGSATNVIKNTEEASVYIGNPAIKIEGKSSFDVTL